MIAQSTLDGPTLREAFGQYPSGVVAVCAEIGGERIGMAASSFVSVSLDPPLVAVCPQNTSATWPRLQESPRIGISILGETHDGAVRSLSAKIGDRFEGLTTQTHEGGAVFIEGASVWLNTSVEQELPAGDHTIIVLRINDLSLQPNVAPIVFHRSGLHRIQQESA
ncbi:flavin reductase family protein [Rhodococcus sp. NPDC127530]|uniref:flavin reductase family protein n=1 Tax=unclassified Rhodococcus (in: high G+C Gram-positive bacteria) TaxID=192944 RepID=UPI00363055CF